MPTKSSLNPGGASSRPFVPPLVMHVLGSGKGESIVLQLPTGEWGVVDCYTSELQDPDANPTVQLLQAEGVRELAFVCLTHPHDDHFRGLNHLLDPSRFHVREFWRFCLAKNDFQAVVERQRAEAVLDEDQRAIEGNDNLLQTLLLVGKLTTRKPQPLVPRQAPRDLPLYPDRGAPDRPPCTIRAVAPSNLCEFEYGQAVLNGMTGTGPMPTRHNAISLALLIEYGKSRVLLGGDVERRTWDRVFTEYGSSQVERLFLRTVAIKVSHHGSVTGHHQDLWAHMTNRGKHQPVAVITPFRQHRLPRDNGLELIRAHTKKVFLTCSRRPADGIQAYPNVKPRQQKMIATSGLQGLRTLAPVNRTTGRCTLRIRSTGHVSIECFPPAGPA
jgi:beta-lactamase superfamily II metal-dependent hydrolase